MPANNAAIRALWMRLPNDVRAAEWVPAFGRFLRDSHPMLIRGVRRDLDAHLLTVLRGLY
jgi:hypothetical protein